MQPGTTLGHYEILSAIGKGGMGEVWKALDTRLGRDVAIKTLPPEFARDAGRLTRFEREARLLATVNHVGIAAIYGLEESGGSRFLVLELVEGETLADRLQRGAIPLEESLTIVLQIADALEAAHEKGVIHRDLKPANIKVTPDGKVKVLDFGLAKAFGSDQPESNLSDLTTSAGMAATQHGLILGTAGYMSPEQARGLPVDKRTDIWAFGVVLYEMLTGRRLFEGGTVSDSLAAVLMKEVDLKGAPLKTQKLLRACLERDPKRRLRDIGEAWRLLEDSDPAPQSEAGLSRRTLLVAGPFAAIAALAVWAPWRSEPVQSLRRFPVDLGPDVRLPPAGFNFSFLISPDDTFLVYGTAGSLQASTTGRGRGRGRGGAGGPMFIQRLDQAKTAPPVELRGTEGAVCASFSPDSRWIAFFSNSSIKKISIDGGPVMELARLGGSGGVLWGDDDMLLVTGPDGLWRIPAAGGKDPVQLKLAEGGLARIHQILPDGKTVLATTSLPQPARENNLTSIEAIFLPDGSRKPILSNAGTPRYLPTGHLVYTRQGALFAVPFDPGKVEPRGDAVLILDDVQSTNGQAPLAISSNGTLVYRRGIQATSETSIPLAVIDWIDEKGNRPPLIAGARRFFRPRLSSDGTRVAVLVAEPGSTDVWVYSVQGDAPVKVTFGVRSITNVVWTQDSRYLIFGTGSERGGTIYWTTPDGAGQHRKLRDTEGLIFLSSFSQGRLVYFQTNSTGSEIFTARVSESNGELNADTPELFFMSQFREQRPHLSLDGQWMAYSSDKIGPQFDVFVRAFPQPRSSQVELRISDNGGDVARWTRDGKLLYQSGDQILSVGYSVREESFVKGQQRVRVEKLRGTDWDVAPDGRIAVVTPIETEAPAAEHTLVFLYNFFDQLRRQVPGR